MFLRQKGSGHAGKKTDHTGGVQGNKCMSVFHLKYEGTKFHTDLFVLIFCSTLTFIHSQCVHV